MLLLDGIRIDVDDLFRRTRIGSDSCASRHVSCFGRPHVLDLRVHIVQQLLQRVRLILAEDRCRWILGIQSYYSGHPSALHVRVPPEI